MNKEMIERIAIEVAEEMPGGFIWFEGCGYEAGILEDEVREFAVRFLTRIDAERGKEAVLHGQVMHMPSGAVFDTVIAAVEPSDLVALTPQPAIPEGRALVPVEQVKDAERFTFLQNLPASEAQAFFWNYQSRKQRAKAIDAMLAAAKEPRHD